MNATAASRSFASHRTRDFESTVTNLRPLRDVEVVDKGGFSSLLIDAEKIVNDGNNPKG
jgi:hypothetical protein